jgi:hypothetical protein
MDATSRSSSNPPKSVPKHVDSPFGGSPVKTDEPPFFSPAAEISQGEPLMLSRSFADRELIGER